MGIVYAAGTPSETVNDTSDRMPVKTHDPGGCHLYQRVSMDSEQVAECSQPVAT
jgi:hypothetical protein